MNGGIDSSGPSTEGRLESDDVQPDAGPTQLEIDELIILYQRRAFQDVVRAGERLVSRHPDALLLYNILGAAHMGLGAFESAELAFKQAITRQDGHAELHNNLGSALEAQGKPDEAIAAFRRALSLAPDYASAHYNLGNMLRKNRSALEAIEHYKSAIALKPDYAEAFNNLGLALEKLRSWADAAQCYERAIALKPDFAESYNNLGLSLQKLGQPERAIQCYRHALSLRPDYANALHNLATALADMKEYASSAKAFELALAAKPDDLPARMQKSFVQMQICDFSAVRRFATPPGSADRDDTPVPPWMMLAFADDPAAQLRHSQQWAQALAGPHARSLGPVGKKPGERIRVGYFSADFHTHATLHLMAGLFREHDRDRFEIIVYSYGAVHDDSLQAGLVGDVDRFIDASHLSDDDFVSLARADQLDIAVDLKGYTEHSRSHLFCRGLAPIQINYLGYPGSMGADFIDYIIADPVLIPESLQPFYSEKIIYLADSYQPNDDQRGIAELRQSRGDVGLPEDGFVFCAFHQSYKIGPDEFDVWMRILQQVGNGVLWLLKGNAAAEANLRREAQARGVDPARLVFAEALPHDQHLARLALADLFLDTFNVNAHTTASDALWAGLPLVTKAGRQFAARVGASLLHAVGLPELVTDTTESYEALVLELAVQPSRLAALRARLKENRLASPLFGTKRYAEKLEKGYLAALQRHAQGLPPATILVS